MNFTALAERVAVFFGKIKFGLLALLILGAALPGLLLVVQLIEVAQQRVVLTADELNVRANNIPNVVSPVQAVESPKQPTITDLGKLAPDFGALAVLAEDVKTGRVLFGKDVSERRSPASTTKLMSALVAIEYYKLGDILTVMPEDIVGGSSMGLHSGETVTFRGLLYGMLLNSGNDAAFTIARNYPGGLSGFIEKMNLKAKELGLKNTHFQNPAGFDGNTHYSSAEDLAKIATEAVENEQIAKIVATKDTSVLAMDRSKEHDLHNLNQLLNEPGVIGIKTGFTEKSGENFVGLVERDNHKVLTVVMGSNDRFGETKALMNWVYSNFVWGE